MVNENRLLNNNQRGILGSSIKIGVVMKDIDVCGNNMLDKVPTYILVEELRKRSGVEVTDVDPYEDKVFEINGPAIVLVVID